MKRVIKTTLLLILLAAVLLGLTALLPSIAGMGWPLVCQDEPKPCELIVVLSGLPLERGLSAAQAYKKGLGPRVYLAREREWAIYRELEAQGVRLPHGQELLRQIFGQMGLSTAALVLPAEPVVNNTYEEALLVRSFARENRISSILLITSASHSCRAKAVFEHVLGPQVEIVSHPSHFRRNFPRTIWDRLYLGRQMLVELAAQLYYRLRYFLID